LMCLYILPLFPGCPSVCPSSRSRSPFTHSSKMQRRSLGSCHVGGVVRMLLSGGWQMPEPQGMCARRASHLISSHLISSHLISSHLISSHLISSHLISSHLISSHVMLRNARFALNRRNGSFLNIRLFRLAD
jgi:hypothetical protein